MDELFHIGHVQADRRFVQNIQRVWHLVATLADIVAYFAEFSHQLVRCASPLNVGEGCPSVR